MKKCSAVVCIILLVAGLAQSYTLVTRDSLASWLNHGAPFGFVLIDVRDSTEIDQVTPADSCVIGTVSCRPYNLSYYLGIFDQKKSLLTKTVPVIVYCRSGTRSGNAAKLLDSMGFTSVYSLSGGFSSWNGPKMPHSYVKSSSLLPQLSYTKSSIRQLGTTTRAGNNATPVFCELIDTRSIVLRTTRHITFPHELSIITLRGTCVAHYANPFSSCTSIAVNLSSGSGVYSVVLKSPDEVISQRLVRIK